MDYRISAVLTLRDELSSKLNAAAKKASAISRGIGSVSKGIGDIKPIRLNVQGLEKLQRLRSMLQSAGHNMPPINIRVNDSATGKIGKLRADISTLTNKAHSVLVNVRTNGAAALGKIRTQISELTTGAALGMGASMLGVAGIGFGVVNAVKSQMDFEKAMSNVQAVLGYRKEQMSPLQEEAERIGYSTKYTAEQAAQAQYYAAMAGWKEEQIIAGGRNIVNLAAAGNVDLARTSDVVTDLLTAFGLRAGENLRINNKPIQEASGHFADAMAAMITNANTDIEQSYEALKYSAPVVSAMYADQNAEAKAAAMRDSFVITGLMANAGIKGSMAGTSQRALYSRLASENRNAYFAEKSLGVSFTDESGQVRRLRDIIGDFRNRFQNGLDPEYLMDVAEEFAGEKIHADTRRKLSGFIGNALKNGGKMTGADRLKMTGMLAGQEAMSGWLSVLLASEEEWNNLAAAIDNCEGKAQEMADIQTDNLAGDFVRLGSAWDAFQRNLVKGDASAGLRDFAQGLNGVINTANTLFKDGIQFSDWLKIGGDAISRLKNKFLELDGVGSILAGGALFIGMKKILQTALRLKDTISAWSKVKSTGDIGQLLRGNQSIGSQVGTMHVNAGVVNLTGAIKGVSNTSGNVVAGQNQARGNIVANQNVKSANPLVVSNRSGSIITPYNAVNRQQNIAARNAAYVEGYYAQKANILASGQNQSVLRANAGVIGAGVGISAIFGLMDVAAAHSIGKMSVQQTRAEVDYQKEVLKQLEAAGESEETIAAQVAKVTQAQAVFEESRQAAIRQERQAEAGAVGMVAGTAIGAALGSFVPVVGTMLGGMVGGAVGQLAGVQLAKFTAESREEMRANYLSRQSKVTDETLAMSGITKSQIPNNPLEMPTDILTIKTEGEVLAEKFEQARRWREEYQNDKAEEMKINRRRLGIRFNEGDAPLSESEMSEGRFLSDLRDRYKEDWLQRYGGTSLAGNATYIPDSEEKREILRRYDNEMAVQSRQSEDSGKSAAVLGEVISRLPIMRGLTALDNLIFNKAAANPIHAESEAQRPLVNAFEVSQALAQSEESLNQLALASADYNQQAQLQVQNQQQISEAFKGISLGLEVAQNLANQPEKGISEAKSEIELPELGLKEKITAEMEGVNEILATFGENLTSTFSNFEMPELGIGEKFTAEFEGVNELFATFGESVSATFSGLTSGISGALSGVGTAITSVFSSAASEVQGQWGAMPGFFSGIFGSLGGVAAAAGSAIAAGLTSGIGTVIGAWSSAAAQISSIIASISAQASSISVPSVGGVAAHAKGTSYFAGGFTEINEHGGEIVNLPSGTQIIPHATTVKILRREVRESINRGESEYRGIRFSEYVPEKRVGTRWNKKPSTPFTNISLGGGLIPELISAGADKKGTPLAGDILYKMPNQPLKNVEVGTRRNMKKSTPFTNIALGSGMIPELIGAGMDFDNLPNIPIEMPKVENGENTTSTSNTINLGGVSINNGADLNEFLYKMQQMLGQAVVNSEWC